MLAAFLFIVLFAVGVSYFFEIDSRRSEFNQAKSLLESNQAGIVNKQAQIDALRVQYDAARVVVERNSSLSDTKSKLTREIAELKAEREKLIVDFAAQVTKVRSATEGAELGVITLATGQGLQGAKVQKVGEEDVTLTHTLGVTKVAPENLPPDLQQKFRYGKVPFTLLKPGAEPTPVVAAPAAGTAPSATSTLAKANKIQMEIDQKQNQINQLEQVRRQWLDKAGQMRNQASTAQSNGRPSYTFNAQAAQCEQNANQASQQSLALKNEIARLQADLANAAVGK
ncbi:hypothetical protein [Verrucomicrobium sp. BvORR106]|uniref:hypothetical protein n=1 Tax=Verrucomicrobium sp. BvORR106 TaxID=1403819 RepID=UPI002240F9C0|nr:hypothetical protein [Verrucomicrobium sp. BvORR106]